MLALIAERVAATPFHDLVRDVVCMPAGMDDTAFLRSDELPGRAALGYIQVDGGWRTNVFHLPVRGSGDGGIYTTATDVAAFWPRCSPARSCRRKPSRTCSRHGALPPTAIAAMGSASGSRLADAR